MRLLTMGVSHRTACLDVRERLAVPPSARAAIFSHVQRHPAISEHAVLSTCNRVECYLVGQDLDAIQRHVMDILVHRSGLPRAALAEQLYVHTDAAAAAHLFRVAAGLDSMIVGESEIAAQVKQAYLAAWEHGVTGPVLNRLFQKALHNAKLIRTQTGIASGQVSLGAVVTALAGRAFSDGLAQHDALLWGAGKAAEMTARHMRKAGIRQLWVVNRTPSKAQDLAAICQGGWLSWEQAIARLAHVDVAIVCTQAPHYVIDVSDLERVAASRGGRPWCLIDLSVPRNIDPALRSHPLVRLYDIDDLQAIARGTVARREQARADCEAFIGRAVAHFLRWRDGQPLNKEGRLCTVS